jgi:hypothetical protein
VFFGVIKRAGLLCQGFFNACELVPQEMLSKVATSNHFRLKYGKW